MKPSISYILCALLLGSLLSCGVRKQTTGEQTHLQIVGPSFIADSAYAFCAQQCSFGPRTMNSEAHDLCGAWIASKFQSYGLTVTQQQTTLQAYGNSPLKCTNIIASYKPALSDRILLCAHWDTRPWADNDPDEANHQQPVMGANDGGSGVAVLLEVARLLASDTLQLGVDFVCFDAEDIGDPPGNTRPDSGDWWAMGAKYWAAHPHQADYKPRFGILLDMVGGQGAQFYKEHVSMQHASAVVDKFWQAAQIVGYGSMFPSKLGPYLNDDHVPVNEIAKIPCIDVIAYYPDCEQSTFGPTWHTVNDTMDHIDRSTLQAVGQTVVQVLFSER